MDVFGRVSNVDDVGCLCTGLEGQMCYVVVDVFSRVSNVDDVGCLCTGLEGSGSDSSVRIYCKSGRVQVQEIVSSVICYKHSQTLQTILHYITSILHCRMLQT